MKKMIAASLVALGLMPGEVMGADQSIYEYKVTQINGEEISLSQYKDKVVMIVNVASKCGFTNQYEGLEKVYNQYKDRGFVVLGFPSNDFGAQEPGTEKEIQEFCKLNYGVTFPLFKKGPVKGDEKQELFKYLTKGSNSVLTGDVAWNFEKFLINKKGQLVERYRSITKPESKSVTDKIEELLK